LVFDFLSGSQLEVLLSDNADQGALERDVVSHSRDRHLQAAS
jgi:hypothetical protein